ncbi:MAG: hypothetical protein F4Y34_10745 [Gammaproteobacteria bacterium]|nr:hypothetical protein [Gammaproteobacteria bacterium]
MKINSLLEKIYNEKDFATLMAASAAAFSGILAYVLWNDVFIGSAVIIMIFPIVKVLLTGYSKKWKFHHDQYQKSFELENTFNNLGSEELKVVSAFVDYGGNTIDFNEHENSSEYSDIGTNSLINRGLIELTENSYCSRAGYCLNEDLFNFAVSKMSKTNSN